MKTLAQSIQGVHRNHNTEIDRGSLIIFTFERLALLGIRELQPWGGKTSVKIIKGLILQSAVLCGISVEHWPRSKGLSSSWSCEFSPFINQTMTFPAKLLSRCCCEGLIHFSQCSEQCKESYERSNPAIETDEIKAWAITQSLVTLVFVRNLRWM